MPSLKDVKCSIELSDNQQSLQEFGTSYGDGLVETFIRVPSEPQSFSVHLTSEKFIAPGIAMYVFIDGVYQCNRNRQDLKLRKATDSRSLVDFRVRQKEEKQEDGTMIAREWKFEKLDIVSADEVSHRCSSDVLANIGCIEVVVLRCAGPRNAKTSLMNVDGANDVLDHVFGMDGEPAGHSSDSTFDDRLPYSQSRGTGLGPPPPLGHYQPPYAETLRSHGRVSARSQRGKYSVDLAGTPFPKSSRGHSRHSEAMSPGTRRSSEVPTFGVQYGSGPLPPVGDSGYRSIAGAVAPTNPVIDPVWLDHLVTKAVKQGVEESQRKSTQQDTSAEEQQRNRTLTTSSQLPGAWPTSPFGLSAQPEKATAPTQAAEHHGSTWGQSQGEWTERPPRSRAGTRVTWHDAEPPAWGSTSSANGWSTHEETPTDSWDTDETWGTTKADQWQDDHRRSRSRHLRSPGHQRSQAISPVTIRIRDGRRSKDGLSVRLRSRSRARSFRTERDIPSSSEDHIGWGGNLDTTSQSSDDTVQPSHSQSQVKPRRSRSAKQSHHSRSAHTSRKRSSGQFTPALEPHPMMNASRPLTITPSVMNIGPASLHTDRFHDVQSSANLKFGDFTPQLAPYAPTLPDFVSRAADPTPFDNRSVSSSSWGDNRNKKTVDEKDSWGGNGPDENGWNDVAKDGWSSVGPDEQQAAGGWDAGEKTSAGATRGTESDVWSSHLDADRGMEERKRNDTAEEDTEKPGWLNTTPKDLTTTTITPWRTRTNPNPTHQKEPKHTPKRHSNKTLSHYRKHRSPSPTPILVPTPTPHWQFPPPTPLHQHSHSHPNPTTLSIAPKEALYPISEREASERGIEHQVQAGVGMPYGHAVGRPEYVDCLGKPYATFRFHYRSRAVLRALLGRDGHDYDDDGGKGGDGKIMDGKKMSERQKQKRRKEKEREKNMEKGKHTINGWHDQKEGSVAQGLALTAEWVEEQRRA